MNEIDIFQAKSDFRFYKNNEKKGVRILPYLFIV